MQHLRTLRDYTHRVLIGIIITINTATLSADAQPTSVQPIAITCESYELDLSSKRPTAMLDGYLIAGDWIDGGWHRASNSSATVNHTTFQARGAGTLVVKGEALEMPFIVSLVAGLKVPQASYDKTRNELLVKADQFVPSSDVPLQLSLTHRDTTLTLVCFTRPATAPRTRTGSERIAKASVKPANPVPLATPSPAPSFCNNNRPTGIAYCPPNWVNGSSKGWSTAPATDRSVKPGDICSAKSIGEANQMAVAEANARAAGALNCWAQYCNCSVEPSAKCPPGKRDPRAIPTCQSTDCFYSKTSVEDAKKQCETKAQQIPLCRDYRPSCIDEEPPRTVTPGAS